MDAGTEVTTAVELNYPLAEKWVEGTVSLHALTQLHDREPENLRARLSARVQAPSMCNDTVSLSTNLDC